MMPKGLLQLLEDARCNAAIVNQASATRGHVEVQHQRYITNYKFHKFPVGLTAI
jgi:hypothetical protein